MGCGASKPFDEAEFLQPHEAEATNILPPTSLGTLTIAFPTSLTGGEGHVGLLAHARSGFKGMGGIETTVEAAADLIEVATAVQVDQPSEAARWSH